MLSGRHLRDEHGTVCDVLVLNDQGGVFSVLTKYQQPFERKSMGTSRLCASSLESQGGTEVTAAS